MQKGLGIMITGNVLVRYGYVPGIVCCSSASGILGMSGCSDWKFSMYCPHTVSIDSRWFKFYPMPEEEIETQVVNGLTVTTPFQTIIDMIRFNCDVEYTTDSLSWWAYKYSNLDYITDTLKERGLYERYVEDYLPYFKT